MQHASAGSGAPLLAPAQVPLLISCPHDGVALPAWLAARMHLWASSVPDTDWHVARLYAPARNLGAGLLRPHWSRYLVDLNRSPAAEALYPGLAETTVCPLRAFDGRSLYLPGQEPDADEQAVRVRDYWQPYHDRLQQQIAQLLVEHGRVVLWEAHSIRSRVPMFFEGQLPDLNVGTYDGCSCDLQLQDALQTVLAGQKDFDWVLNGRFKGGYITRHYGRPAHGVSAVQLEISQSAYMDEDTGAWNERKAAALRPLLLELLRTAINWTGPMQESRRC